MFVLEKGHGSLPSRIPSADHGNSLIDCYVYKLHNHKTRVCIVDLRTAINRKEKNTVEIRLSSTCYWKIQDENKYEKVLTLLHKYSFEYLPNSKISMKIISNREYFILSSAFQFQFQF